MDSIFQWFMEHKDSVIELIVALVLVLEIIANLTPSEKDNSILLKIKNLISKLFPNNKIGGGTHE